MSKKKNSLYATQHYSSLSKKLIGNLWNDLPDNIQVIEPFVGAGDLFLNSPKGKVSHWELYDIEPKLTSAQYPIIQQDTLLSPPNYQGKYVITNPPYLARNKNDDKTIYNKYQVDDLYKAFIKTLFGAEGGIVILPLNFLTDERSQKIRKEFLTEFSIPQLNIFTDPMFERTNYQVCSFSFLKKYENKKNETKLNIISGADKPTVKFLTLNEESHPILFEDSYNTLFKPVEHPFKRYTTEVELEDDNFLLPITGHLLDSTSSSFNQLLRNEENKAIRLEYTPGGEFQGKPSSRTKLSVYIKEDDELKLTHLTRDDWTQVVEEWNNLIREYRKDTFNLTLSNYRDVNRKRMSFKEFYHSLWSIIKKKTSN